MSKISGIGVYVPGGTRTIEETISDVLKKSEKTFIGNLNKLKTVLEKLFDRAGSYTRSWPENNNYILMDWIHAAVKDVLIKTKFNVESMDCVIYCGCGKGYTEPSQAAFCAKVIGCENAEAFDVSEACNGYIRSLEIADMLLKKPHYNRILIITAMDGAGEGTNSCYELNSLEELQYKFGGLTIGCCSTATIIEKADSDLLNLSVQRICDNSIVEACIIPTTYFKTLGIKNSKFDKYTIPGQFNTFSKILYDALRDLSSKSVNEFDKKDVQPFVFTHSVSMQLYDEVKWLWNSDSEFINTHGITGNITESSLPLSIYLFQNNGIIKSCERVSFVGHGAGASLVLVSLNTPSVSLKYKFKM